MFRQIIKKLGGYNNNTGYLFGDEASLAENLFLDVTVAPKAEPVFVDDKVPLTPE